MPPRRTSVVAARAATATRAVATVAPMTAAAVEQLIQARVSAALANHETLQNSTNGHGDGSYNSDTGIRGTIRTSRECTYKDFLNCKPLVLSVVKEWLFCHNGLKRWNWCSISATVLWKTKLSLLLALSLEML
ncbi:hypothetical protein Tco_1246067 [Tanacetum coccineum]